jgi:hypothetical protein
MTQKEIHQWNGLQRSDNEIGNNWQHKHGTLTQIAKEEDKRKGRGREGHKW